MLMLHSHFLTGFRSNSGCGGLPPLPNTPHTAHCRSKLKVHYWNQVVQIGPLTYWHGLPPQVGVQSANAGPMGRSHFVVSIPRPRICCRYVLPVSCEGGLLKRHTSCDADLTYVLQMPQEENYEPHHRSCLQKQRVQEPWKYTGNQVTPTFEVCEFVCWWLHVHLKRLLRSS